MIGSARVLALVGTVAAALIATSVPAAAGKLSIATGVWVGFGSLYLARDLGYFAERGVEVDLTETGEADAMVAALASGRISGSCSTVETLLRTRTEATCFKAVIALDDSSGADGMLTAGDVRSLSQLKGATIGLSERSSSELLLRYMAHKQGLSPSDFNVVNMRPDDAAAAFIAGRLPAAVTYEPNLTFVRNAHIGNVLFDSRATPGLIVDLVVMRCDVIERQKQDVAGFVAAVLKADDFIRANPERAYDVMRKYVGGYLDKVQQFAEAAKGVNYYGRSENASYIGTLEKPGSVSSLIKTIVDLEGSAITLLPFQDYFDPEFLSASS